MTDISLCMICRDDANNLRHILSRARPHVDEIVVVDTGSADNSREVASMFADKTLSVPRQELMNFGEMRELSYSLSSCDWRLWLDSDDDLSDWGKFESSFEKVIGFRNEQGPGSYGRMWYDYTWDTQGNCLETFTRERITHKDDGWRWIRPIHEYQKSNIKKKSVTVDARVVHKSLGARGIENDRNLKILLEWKKNGVVEDEESALYYYLGDEMLIREKYTEAISYYQKSTSYEKKFWEHRAIFRTCIAKCRNHTDDALSFLNEQVEKYPDIMNFRALLALHLFNGGNILEAHKTISKAFECPKIIESEDPFILSRIERFIGVER